MRRALGLGHLILLSGLIIYVACQKEISYEGGIRNLPPVAKAGKDTLIAYPSDSVRLDGSLSFDPDGTITGFSWRKVSGPASLSIVNVTNAVTKVTDLDTGSYRFELKVTDDKGLSSKDTVSVVVDKTSVKHPPIADAGYDQVIILPEHEGLLDGVLSYDLDDDIATYTWTKISGPSVFAIINNGGRQTRATNLSAGIYLFELKVTDSTGLSSKDTVKINVRSAPIISPVADAGADITINYNLQTCSLNESVFTLNGSASYDPDGTITKYQWAFVFADNTSVSINNPGEVITKVMNLMPGSYTFKLEVTDNDGAKDTDTVSVTTQYINRPSINARLIPIGNLSRRRKVSAVAAANGKILFAGGYVVPTIPGSGITSLVDIYDIATNTWSGAELSEPKTNISAVTLGDNIYFAGGNVPRVGLTATVDIYNATTNSWSTTEMPHGGSKFGSIAFGNMIYVAGGDFVNVYDVTTRRWKSNQLSEYRFLITPVIKKGIPNTVLHFMGGVQDEFTGSLSSRIDIYDPVSDSWSVNELDEPKFGMIASGDVLAGGTTENGLTNKVFIGTDPACLFQPNSFSYHSYGKTGNKLVFFIWDGKAKNKFDIYDISTNTWSIGVLDKAITPSLVISVNNTIYVAGGEQSNDGYYDQVWKLEF